MTNALDQVARGALERFVQRSRRLLEDALARQAEGRFGIHAADGTIEDEDGLHLNPDDLAARRDIVDVLQFIRREERDHAVAVARLIREAAFTHLNRLVAIRIAEALALLPESLANGPASAGYRELLEVAPLLAQDASGGYWRYLQLCGDELAADLPQLFDPRNPLLELTPSPAAFDELIELLTAPDLDPVWDAPDALGWAYQFFNSGDERRAMRDASPSPRNSRELAVRNQFFTPRYVVDFLVHNSLGRRLLEADPTSPLIDDLPLLLDPPTESGESLDLAEVRVLDPACGSGHFLLGAYDVLERAWHHAGVEPDHSAPYIVASLWGIDIDSRCAQVAAAAIMLRARRACRIDDLPTPNIICARALPEPTEGWDALLAGLPDDRRQLVAAMRDTLDQAAVLGPLLKVEEHLATQIRARIAGADHTEGNLFAAAGTADESFSQAEADVLAVLQQVADQTTSSPADRFFAAEANDAIRFVDALRHRYDSVLMNPPFGEPALGTKVSLRKMYPELPGSSDLFAAFVTRGVELLRTGGSLGAITSRVGFFLTTFERWRRDVLLANDLVALVDLGLGVMEQAMVEAAAYVVRSQTTESLSARTTCVRLVRSRTPEFDLAEICHNHQLGIDDARVFKIRKDEVEAIPGAPYAYWAHPELRELFRSCPPIEGQAVEAKMGLSSGDDFRFVRLWWEVGNEESAWVPYSKGGEYSPFYFEPHLLVDWSGNGTRIRSSGASWVALRNERYYFREGIGWPRRTGSGFGPRLMPRDCIFGDKGPAAFCDEGLEPLVLTWLLSRPVSALLSFTLAAANETSMETASKSYEVGLIQRLPWPGEALARLGELANELVDRGVAHQVLRLRRDETSRLFAGHGLPQDGERLGDSAERMQRELEDSALKVLELSGRFDAAILNELSLSDGARGNLDDEVSSHPWTYPEPDPGPTSQVIELWSLPVVGAVNALLNSGRGTRAIAQQNYVIDRHIEVICHGLKVHPRTAIGVRRQAGVLPPNSVQQVAEDFLSFAVGSAFGRWPSGGKPTPLTWDARTALAQLPPSWSQANSGSDDHGTLLDEPGHASDIVALLEAWAGARNGAEAHLAEALSVLSSAGLRQHLRVKFFKSHLARYSKSRRRAPIYWPLYVPSGKWGIWVYGPRLTRETLYVVASEALRREGHAEVEIERLQRERATGDGGRGPRALDKALDEERKLAEELHRFRQEAERIAGLGWDPDLNDGVVLCGAPLADLFPQWRNELASYRDELRAGKYEWSTVSKWAEQL